MKTTSLKREDMITDIMKYNTSYLKSRLNKLNDIQLLIIKASAEIEASSESNSKIKKQKPMKNANLSQKTEIWGQHLII